MMMSQFRDNGYLLKDNNSANGNEYKGPEAHNNGKNGQIESEYINVISNINNANSNYENFIINDSCHSLSDSQSVDELSNVAEEDSKSSHDDDDEKSQDVLVNSRNLEELTKVDLQSEYFDGLMSKDLTTSTISLNEANDNMMKIGKSPLSKSAENICIQNRMVWKNNSSSNSENLNEGEILDNFKSQKIRAAAIQKIVPDHGKVPMNLESKNIKIHKDTLAPDLGYIVKNVHGIFSSVSGSLKNAYNMSQRVSYQAKPINNLSKMSNGNVLNDIFDDHRNDNLAKENVDCDVKTSVDDILKIEVEGSDDGKSDSSEVFCKEIVLLKRRIHHQAEELQIKDHTLKDLEGKLELMHRNLEQVKKEKDTAVMRYASVECSAIEARKIADTAAKAQKTAAAEVALAENKLKLAQAERRRVCQMYDDKCHELSTSERDLAKTREELKELEGRLKWTQSKLRLEADAYKESADKAERLAARVAELEAEKESGAAALADATKMKQLESEVRESQASLILARHQAEELERKLTSTHQQLTNTQQELNDVKTTLAKYQAEVMTLRNSNVLLEQEAAELAALRARAALADTLTSQLHRETERAALAEEALSKERARADTCARREAAALEHAARLTAHHVAERAQTDHEKDKATALAADNASLRETVTALKAEVEELKRSLSAEESRRTSESKTLARRVAELTEELKTTNEKLDWERAENGLLKKRHATALKEVNRELQRALKRCEQLEAKVPHDHDESVRTGSVSSLSSDGIMNHHSQNLEVSSSPDDVPVNGQSSEPEKPDRQALIERIVQLQRSLARRADRCEFLEEHARHLTSELRRKSRLLRHALPALPAGALPTAASDRHKKEVAALGGGAMAAVWGAGDADALSPQLALEMNRRLHAVLEDALLKNITLKENLDTLGEEIARLKSEKGAR